ncbi:MAG TPA: amidohydrolase family protein [Candidatus Didemnitutus sp.]|nr:amidohydrolase family protein [Candidatus Didemnitutus sp.]
MTGPFVDSHVHFWDPARLSYGYLSSLPSISARHDTATLTAEAGPDGPAQCVFVQAECDRTQWLDEVRWIERLARDDARLAAIVAHVTVDAPGTLAAHLDELRRHPLVRGVRHLIQDEADPRFCLRDEFVAGVREAGRRGLSFDVCCRHHQLPAVIELVRQCPSVNFILDHGGKPAIGRGETEPWNEHIRALAALPNVTCKLSGLVTEASPRPPTAATLRPYVAILLETFGPARLLFGSDWPIAKLAATYREWVATAAELLAALSNAERDAIFRTNARRVYRLA